MAVSTDAQHSLHGDDGQPPATGTTSTGKQHFEVLDGMRGTAAMLVVLFHIQGITVHFHHDHLMFQHAYLAVDFFFALSGFVIGYAYDDRWGRMGVKDFIRTRLIRLHPLVILGTLFGFGAYVLDPFAGDTQNAPWSLIALALVTGMLLLPTVPLPNRWLDTHTLNGASWTLLQEYIGNLAYALVLRRLSARSLGWLALLCGAVLLACGMVIGTLDRGYAWNNLWMAPVRLFFPFIAGLWLYRVRDRLPRLRLGYLPLSILLVLAFMAPRLPDIGGVKLNGLYEAACVIILFPAIVMTGAHSNAGRGMGWLCRISGSLSYPIYITHFPFMYVWGNYVAQGKAPQETLTIVAFALIPLVTAIAWASLRFWDEPIRTRLRHWRA